MPPKKLRRDHALNIFITGELKQAMVEFAGNSHLTLADVARRSISLGLPLLKVFWEYEDQFISEHLVTVARKRLTAKAAASKPKTTNPT